MSVKPPFAFERHSRPVLLGSIFKSARKALNHFGTFSTYGPAGSEPTDSYNDSQDRGWNKSLVGSILVPLGKGSFEESTVKLQGSFPSNDLG